MDSVESCKIFVGGLSPDSTEADLQKYFSQFGVVTNVVVKRDAMSGRARGFGFVSFASPEAVSKLQSVPQHIINDKRVDPKPAQPQVPGSNMYGDRTAYQNDNFRANQPPEQMSKIFVGGVDANMDEIDIKAHFEQLTGSTVSKIEWPYDKMRQQKKNFLFIQFDQADAVDRVLQGGNKQAIGAKVCDLKRAFVSGSGMMGSGNGYNERDPSMYERQMMMGNGAEAMPGYGNEQYFQWQQMAAAQNPGNFSAYGNAAQQYAANPNMQAYYNAYAAQNFTNGAGAAEMQQDGSYNAGVYTTNASAYGMTGNMQGASAYGGSTGRDR